MTFAVVNILGVKSFIEIWPLLIIYAGGALFVFGRRTLLRTHPVLLGVATMFGLGAGSFLGHVTTIGPAGPQAVATGDVWQLQVALAAERVDRQKEVLAQYIDENLPDIPEVLHANCRELEDALAAHGLLCVDVGPKTERTAGAPTTDTRGFELWRNYRAAKADLDRLISSPATP